MRRYARAGLDLHPAVAAAGIPDAARIPDAAARVEDAGDGGLAVADAIGRAVRGAGHARDLPSSLRHGARLLVLEDRAFALLGRTGAVALLAARDEAAAQTVLWGAFAPRPRGATVSVDFLTRGPAVGAARAARRGPAALPRRPGVPARGRRAASRPYVPSGAWL